MNKWVVLRVNLVQFIPIFSLKSQNVITTPISDIFLNEKMISFSIIGNKLTMK